MNINAIHYRTAQFTPVPVQIRLRTSALPVRITQEPARTRVCRHDDLKIARKDKRLSLSEMRYLFLFYGDPQGLDHILIEFAYLIKEEHTVVRQSYLTRYGSCSSADKSCSADRMMRGPERPPVPEAYAVRTAACDRCPRSWSSRSRDFRP